MKGKKMAGQLGFEKVTIQNLKVVMVDPEKEVILVSGSVPGPNKGYVIVKTSVKKGN
jgi:large subunit ribosomal protein L3